MLAHPISRLMVSKAFALILHAESVLGNVLMQVQATFAGGLSEHLQAAGGANAAASLHESLGTAAQLVDDLKTGLHEGQNKLIQLASQKSKHMSLLLQDIGFCQELMPRPCFTACDSC